MNKLIKLSELCASSVSVEFNEHTVSYITVKEMVDMFPNKGGPIPEPIKAKMIIRNEMVCVQFYPRTPVSCYVIYHYDLELALDQALEIMEKINGK